MSSYIRLIYSTGSRRTYARNPIESKTNANKLTNSTIVLIVANPGCAKSKSAWILLVQSISPESPRPSIAVCPDACGQGARAGFPSLAPDYSQKGRARQSGGSIILGPHFRVRKWRDFIRQKYDPAGGGLILCSYANCAFLVRFRR
jgi:hypothetical protein